MLSWANIHLVISYKRSFSSKSICAWWSVGLKSLISLSNSSLIGWCAHFYFILLQVITIVMALAKFVMCQGSRIPATVHMREKQPFDLQRFGYILTTLFILAILVKVSILTMNIKHNWLKLVYVPNSICPFVWLELFKYLRPRDVILCLDICHHWFKW